MSNFKVVPDKKMPNLYVVKSLKGPIPEALLGLFSTQLKVKKKIEAYDNRPRPQPINYRGSKKITDEQEAEMLTEVVKKVEAINNGKKEKSKKKRKG